MTDSVNGDSKFIESLPSEVIERILKKIEELKIPTIRIELTGNASTANDKALLLEDMRSKIVEKLLGSKALGNAATDYMANQNLVRFLPIITITCSFDEHRFIVCYPGINRISNEEFQNILRNPPFSLDEAATSGKKIKANKKTGKESEIDISEFGWTSGVVGPFFIQNPKELPFIWLERQLDTDISPTSEKVDTIVSFYEIALSTNESLFIRQEDLVELINDFHKDIDSNMKLTTLTSSNPPSHTGLAINEG